MLYYLQNRKFVWNDWVFSFQGGLKKETHDSASVKCWPTYVRDLPTGKEQGKFLALDLGGTNFRVLALELTADKEFLMDSKIYAIPQDIMTGISHIWLNWNISKMLK